VRALFLLLLAVTAVAEDVYVPPVPIGVRREGKVRSTRTPIAFPAADEQWIRIRTARYDVISSASDEHTRGIVADLETLASVLTRVSSRFRPGSLPTTVLIFAERDESLPYFELLLGREKPASTGLYVRHEDGGTMFVDASRRRSRIEKTAMHELVHDLLRQTEQVPPLWIEEGLAEYFSDGEIRDGTLTAGAPIRAHAQLVRRRLPLPLPEMFEVKAETDVSMTPAFYAQSWAAVDWLMRLDRDAFFPFLQDLERGTPVSAALEKHYGKTEQDMETGIRAAGSRSTSHLIELEGERAEVPQPRLVDRATLLYELGHFLSYVAGAEEDSQRHYAEALRVDPKHARALAATGRFEEALATGLNDPTVHLAYAETLLTTVIGPFAGIFEPVAGDEVKFRKARGLAERALALGADEGAARAAIGATYLVETDLTRGIEALERAHALLPRRDDISLNLYAMLLRSGQRAKADAFHAEAFANVSDKQVVFAAKNVLLLAETGRANALAKEGKLEDAASIVRDLAASTTDPIARRDLEQQAASLESTASINRHIRMYNDAVALANTGKNGAAVKLLDELLLVATDVVVVRDAKKLRDEVRTRKLR
jgi:tetratricopeptide (TPR) repeat protein